MNSLKLKNNIIHFSFACLITSNAVVNIFKQIGGVSNSIVLLVGGLVSLILIQCNFNTISKITREQVFLSFFLFFILCFSTMIAPLYGSEMVNRQFLFFILMGLGTLCITNFKFNFEKLLKNIILISLILAPILLTGNFTDREGMGFQDIDEKEEWMGYGYSILTLIIADIFYLLVYKNKRKYWSVLSLISLILYVPSFFWHSSRGAFGAILGFLFFAIIQKALQKGKKLSRSFIFVITLFAVLYISFLAFDVESIIMESGVNSLAKFFEDGDVSNGRNRLYLMAMDGFLKSPLWGNGVGSFGNYQIYPHNLFLQFLYEGGILLFYVMTWILYKAVRYMLNIRVNPNKSRLLLLVFACSFFELLFSASFWEKPRFWMTIWITLEIYKSMRNKIIKSAGPVTNQQV